MAKIYPNPIAPDTNSNAERKLYNLFRDKLNQDYTVIHSAKWITRKPREYGPVGEADFVIAHPRYGILVIEVKGGGIHLDRGNWYTINASGEKNPLKKDPVVQADQSVYALRDHLAQNVLTRGYKYPVYHAVAFPDIEVDFQKSLRPDIPRTIIIDRSRLAELHKTIEEIYTFWNDRYHHSPPTSNAIEALTQLLVPKLEIKTKIAHAFEDEDQQIKQLTEAQYGALRLMQMFRRASIIGGAGTGKTMLAVEKARQLSQGGFKVLMLTYNSNLARWITQITSDSEQISVNTFHGLARKAFNEWAKLPALTNQSDYFERPEDLLFEALESIKRNSEKVESFLFDAVIVDEGQDFKSDYWIPISDLLKDSITGVLYVFFDDNQRIYEQLSHIPISKEQQPLVLSDNCRNTKSIFSTLQKYTNTSIDTRCIGPEGRSVEYISAQNDAEAQKKLRLLLHDLIVNRGAEASQIVLLTPRGKATSLWKDGLKFGNYSLKWDALISNNQNIKVSTIQSFKGLESPIVILTEMQYAFADATDQLAYVGISRARNLLIVLGDMPNQKESGE